MHYFRFEDTQFKVFKYSNIVLHLQSRLTAELRIYINSCLPVRMSLNQVKSCTERNSLNKQPLIVYVYMTFALSRERPCEIYECLRYKITFGLQIASRD